MQMLIIIISTKLSRKEKVKLNKVLRFDAHPSCHNGIDIFGVAEGQSHEVSVQCSYTLEHQPDVAGRGKVEQG